MKRVSNRLDQKVAVGMEIITAEETVEVAAEAEVIDVIVEIADVIKLAPALICSGF